MCLYSPENGAHMGPYYVWVSECSRLHHTPNFNGPSDIYKALSDLQ